MSVLPDSFRLLTYNIHKGIQYHSRKFVLESLKESIRGTQGDLVFLQEIHGAYDDPEHRAVWPSTAQFEYLADQVWPHFAYGKNAVYTKGDHGNAILSHFPLEHWENIDVSNNKHERRGILHAVVCPQKRPLHLYCIHFDLFERGRQKQLRRLTEILKVNGSFEVPTIIAGDFNDWRQRADAVLIKEAGLREAFTEVDGHHAKTFPAFCPMLRLDRVYFRDLRLNSAQKLRDRMWSGLSDHLPLLVSFDFLGGGRRESSDQSSEDVSKSKTEQE